MGVVYRAADSALGREVALKILPASLTGDPDRLARFDREARTLASLNHPHIAQIYGFDALPGGPEGPQRALVMELVEGEDLAQRIARGAIPVDEALPIARQIADALAAAHAQRIVHRDLKPANIRIRRDGTVKVLDFGLAKAAATEPGAAAATNSVALTSPVLVTSVGTIVGTAAYMSPEQARGRSVDRRADVWAFGCVLFEMLTGRRAFDGGSVSDVVAAVMRDAPAFDALPSELPGSVRRLLRRCLEKDPARRLDSMRDACLEIDEPNETPSLNQPVRPRRFGMALGAGGLAAVLGLLIAAYILGRRSNTTTAAPVNAELSLAPAESLGPHSLFDRPARPAFAVTSDGRRIVFTGVSGDTTQLYVRSLDGRQASAIPGTTGADTPFLSPDDQWVGFLADGIIRKVPLAGGPVAAICDLKSTDGGTRSPLVRPGTDFFGASWGDDDKIVFGRYTDGLWQVSASGGTPARLTTPAGGWHRLPHHLPRGRGVLLTVSEPRSADGSQVLFMQQDGMGRVRGDGSAPIERLHDGIAYPHTTTPDGLLFGVTNPDSGSDIWAMQLDGVHRPRPLLNSPANEAWAEVSPDGKWLAYGSDSSGRFEVYVQSFPDLGPRQQVSVSGGDSPLWSRNGRELFFRTSGDGVSRLQVVDVTTGPNGIAFGKPHQLFERRFGYAGSPTAYDVSPDGSRFLMTELLDPPSQPVTRLHVVLN